MDAEKAKAIVQKHTKAMLKELAVEVVVPGIEAAAAATETKIDDMAVAALKESALKLVEAI